MIDPAPRQATRSSMADVSTKATREWTWVQAVAWIATRDMTFTEEPTTFLDVHGTRLTAALSWEIIDDRCDSLAEFWTGDDSASKSARDQLRHALMFEYISATALRPGGERRETIPSADWGCLCWYDLWAVDLGDAADVIYPNAPIFRDVRLDVAVVTARWEGNDDEDERRFSDEFWTLCQAAYYMEFGGSRGFSSSPLRNKPNLALVKNIRQALQSGEISCHLSKTAVEPKRKAMGPKTNNTNVIDGENVSNELTPFLARNYWLGHSPEERPDVRFKAVEVKKLHSAVLKNKIFTNAEIISHVKHLKHNFPTITAAADYIGKHFGKKRDPAKSLAKEAGVPRGIRGRSIKGRVQGKRGTSR